MRNGILTQAAYQRSVYRKLKDDHPGLPEYVWEHCTKIPASGEELVVSESLMTGNEQELFVYAAARAEQTEEESVKEMTKILEGMVKKQDIQILNILVQAAPDIRTMTVSVTGLGWAGEKRKAYRRKYEGREIVLVNPVALEGSLRVLYEKEKEVRERFVPVFLSKLYNSKNDLFAVRAAEKAAGFHAFPVESISDGIGRMPACNSGRWTRFCRIL